MVRGRQITVEQVETVKAVYAETESYAEAARAAGVGENTAKKYVLADDGYAEYRAEKRVGIIARVAEVRALYLEHLADPAIVAATDAKDATVVFGILTDKHQLLSGEATERHEHSDTSADRLARRMDELAARRRAKGVAGEPVAG